MNSTITGSYVDYGLGTICLGRPISIIGIDGKPTGAKRTSILTHANLSEVDLNGIDLSQCNGVDLTKT